MRTGKEGWRIIMARVMVYHTVSGDTWDLIAFKVLGNEKYFHRIIRNNLNLINIAIFDAGTPIIMSDIGENFETKIPEEKLPPWKRG